MMLDKPTLRRQLVANRALQNIPEQSHTLCRHLALFLRARPELTSIFLYAPFGSEPDVFALFALLPTGYRFALPVVGSGPDMQFHSFVPNKDPLPLNRWKIREPLPCPATLVAPDASTVLCVPGLAFDR